MKNKTALYLDAKDKKDLKKMKKVYKADPSNMEVRFEYAKLLVENEQIELGERLFVQLLGTQMEKYARFQLGKLEADLGNIEEAKEQFYSLLGMSNDYTAILELGRIEASTGNIEYAKSFFNSLIGTKGENTAKFELGRIEANIGNIDKAREYFTSVLDKSNDLYTRLELGRLEAKVGNIKKARFHFKSLLETSNALYAILELGRLEAIDGNVEEARKYFDLLLNKENKIYAYRLLMIIEYKLKNYTRVVELINEIIRDNLDDVSKDILLNISKELNIFFKGIDYSKIHSYTSKQIIEYDEYMALEHIITEHCNSASKSCFNDTVDVYKLFSSIKSLLIEKYKLKEFKFRDMYIIPYDNIGLNGEKYLKVVTLPFTDEILSMYPVFNKYDIRNEDAKERKRIKNKQI